MRILDRCLAGKAARNPSNGEPAWDLLSTLRYVRAGYNGWMYPNKDEAVQKNLASYMAGIKTILEYIDRDPQLLQDGYRVNVEVPYYSNI